jgi:hypothetical protein
LPRMTRWDADGTRGTRTMHHSPLSAHRDMSARQAHQSTGGIRGRLCRRMPGSVSWHHGRMGQKVASGASSATFAFVPHFSPPGSPRVLPLRSSTIFGVRSTCAPNAPKPVSCAMSEGETRLAAHVPYLPAGESPATQRPRSRNRLRGPAFWHGPGWTRTTDLTLISGRFSRSRAKTSNAGAGFGDPGLCSVGFTLPDSLAVLVETEPSDRTQPIPSTSTIADSGVVSQGRDRR